MHVTSIAIFVAVATAVPLSRRSPAPQLLGGILDLISGLPVIGPVADSIGALINQPGPVVVDIGNDLTPEEWWELANTIETMRNVVEPYVAASTASKKIGNASDRSNNRTNHSLEDLDPLSDLISNIPVVGDIASTWMATGVNALAGILGLGSDLMTDILLQLGPGDRKTIDAAMKDVKAVFERHMK